MIDFNKRRALTLDGGDDDRITLTTVQDLANVVALAVEYEGEWPVVGGMKGTEISIGELLALGEKVRGTFILPPYDITFVIKPLATRCLYRITQVGLSISRS
jgi:hypothetical protein